MTNCEVCNGTGYVNLGRPPKRFICSDCGGRGEVHLWGNVLAREGYHPTITFKKMEEQLLKKAKERKEWRDVFNVN